MKPKGGSVGKGRSKTWYCSPNYVPRVGMQRHVPYLAGQTNATWTGLTVLIKVEWRSPLIQRTERRHATPKFVRWTNFFACQRPGAHEPVHRWDA